MKCILMNPEKFNSKYLEIWEKFSDDKNLTEYCPVLYQKLNKNALLFVGINPSHPNSLKTRFKKMEESIEDPDEYLKWHSQLSVEKKIIIKKERFYSKSNYRYFTPFKEICEYVDLDWDDEGEHIDLFVNRTKNQKSLINKLDIDINRNILNDFGIEQILVFKQLLKELNPRTIVVENALSREIIQNFMLNRTTLFKVDNSAFETYGFDLIRLGEVKTPIFFTGMLSGQRRLDNGSMRRLKWHIKRSLDWEK